MATINMSDKRLTVAAFVADAIRNRVVDLHTTVIHHWNEVVAEVFDKSFAEQCSNMVRNVIVADSQTRTIALNLSGWTNNVAKYSVTTETVMGVKDRGFFRPSFGPRGDSTDVNHYLCNNINEIWEELIDDSGFVFPLPFPFERMVENKNNDDDSSACELDEDKYKDFLDIDMDKFVPVDCTTQKKLLQTASQLRQDAEQLATATFEAIRICRSVEAIIKIVPQLEPYLCSHTSEDTTSAIDNLLKQVQGK